MTTPRGGTTEAAREEAANLRSSTGERASHVAETATNEARQVAEEVKNQARDLAVEARSQLDDQAGLQRDRLVSGLQDFVGELESMIDSGGRGGLASHGARQIADRTRAAIDRLDGRNPGELLGDVRGFARRRPGLFLVGAVALGVVAGRLTRGAVDSHRHDDRHAGGTARDDYDMPSYHPDTGYPTAAGGAGYSSTTYAGQVPYAAPVGTEDQPLVPGRPAHATDPVHGTAAAYPTESEFTTTTGSAGNFPAGMQYPTETGYVTEPVYPAETGYATETGYPAEPDYPADPGYPAEAGYPPEADYPIGTTPEQDPADAARPGYPSRNDPSYRPDPEEGQR